MKGGTAQPGIPNGHLARMRESTGGSGQWKTFSYSWLPAGRAGYGAGKRPRSATIVVTKNDGGRIGT